jgi:hypothetical protein
MTQVCSPKMTHHLLKKEGLCEGSQSSVRVCVASAQIVAVTRIMMKGLSLPCAKTAAGDDIDGLIPYVDNVP